MTGRPLSEYQIGTVFTCNKQAFLCTDVGNRVVVGIKMKYDWMAGPPYALAEVVFDEDDQKVLFIVRQPGDLDPTFDNPLGQQKK